MGGASFARPSGRASRMSPLADPRHSFSGGVAAGGSAAGGGRAATMPSERAESLRESFGDVENDPQEVVLNPLMQLRQHASNDGPGVPSLRLSQEAIHSNLCSASFNTVPRASSFDESPREDLETTDEMWDALAGTSSDRVAAGTAAEAPLERAQSYCTADVSCNGRI
jgi:hypothetical protein